MRRVYNVLRKVGAVVVGLPLLVVGLILIPVPGPGVLITIAALFILSLGFDGAKPHLDKAKMKIKPLFDKFKEEYEKLKD